MPYDQNETEYLEFCVRLYVAHYIRATSKSACIKMLGDILWRYDENGNPSEIALAVQGMSEFGRNERV
jgi:hypothetical protein